MQGTLHKVSGPLTRDVGLTLRAQNKIISDNENIMVDQMHYKDKYILFIDILGFKKFIESTVKDESTDVIKTQSFYNLIHTLRHDLAMDYNKTGSEWQIQKKNVFFKRLFFFTVIQ